MWQSASFVSSLAQCLTETNPEVPRKSRNLIISIQRIKLSSDLVKQLQFTDTACFLAMPQVRAKNSCTVLLRLGPQRLEPHMPCM